jgi:dihydrofolate synthase / folylpolyglutamate synthase
LSPLTYPALTAELFPRLTGGIRWGLDRTRRMLAAVGDPQSSFRVLHVGGTNGKGSVAAHLESVLRHAGHRTGLYSSPHLCTFRERIRIDGMPVGEDALLAAAEQLWPFIRNEQPSFFEATTAIAFLALAQAGVEYAVIEVGLGGRLDSTNVVNPDVVVLTNVSLDHVQLLGHTLEAVATEKAGIIKAVVPVATGEAGTAAARIFADVAAARGAPLHVLERADVSDIESAVQGTRFSMSRTAWGPLELMTALPGAHQALNAALAVHALGLLGAARPTAETIAKGLASTRWAGRLQVEEVAGVRWVFDVAHNVAGAETLAAALRDLALPRPLVAVIGVLGDKDWQGMLGPLCTAADHVILTTPPTAPADRRWDPDAVLHAVSCAAASTVPDFTQALERAHGRALSAAPAGTVVVTGSFHTVGDALVALGLAHDGADFDVRAPQFRRAAADGG